MRVWKLLMFAAVWKLFVVWVLVVFVVTSSVCVARSISILSVGIGCVTVLPVSLSNFLFWVRLL